VAVVTQTPEGLAVQWEHSSGSPSALRRHLGADQRLAASEAVLGRDPAIRRLLPYTSGIALMRQEPWECLVSFVISAFNNIPKIGRSIEHLSRRFGERIAAVDPADTATEAGRLQDGRRDAWSFPSPERLAGAHLDELRACMLGYRAPYVRELAAIVASGRVDLAAIARLPYGTARRALIELPGVGEKVADCVLLYSLGHREAFPVDVWVQRAVERWYFGGRSTTPRAIRAWAIDRFGPLAGYAQQHLFSGARWVVKTRV
jgi:N-glycosylase/DNA lyase